MASSTIQLFSLLACFAPFSTALALPVSESTATSATGSSSFKLRTVPYDTEFDSDAAAVERFNGTYLSALYDFSSINVVTGSSSTQATNWVIDPNTRTLRAQTEDHDSLFTFVLSDTPASDNPSLPADVGYSLTQLVAEKSSIFEFAVTEDDPDVEGPSIAYIGDNDGSFIFGSFVMCGLSGEESDASSMLLWRGSSKAVWKAPECCALVKLAVEY